MDRLEGRGGGELVCLPSVTGHRMIAHASASQAHEGRFVQESRGGNEITCNAVAGPNSPLTRDILAVFGKWAESTGLGEQMVQGVKVAGVGYLEMLGIRRRGQGTIVGVRLQVLIRKTERRWPRRGCRWDAMTLRPSHVKRTSAHSRSLRACIPCISLQGPCATELGALGWMGAADPCGLPHMRRAAPHTAASCRNSNLEFQLWGASSAEEDRQNVGLGFTREQSAAATIRLIRGSHDLR